MTWHPMDTAPRDGKTRILVAIKRHLGRSGQYDWGVVRIVRWKNNAWAAQICQSWADKDLVGWQPEPTPPAVIYDMEAS